MNELESGHVDRIGGHLFGFWNQKVMGVAGARWGPGGEPRLYTDAWGRMGPHRMGPNGAAWGRMGPHGAVWG
jgi:hypothetical protein